MLLFVPSTHAEFVAMRDEVEADPEFVAWMAEDFDSEFETREAARWAEYSDHHYQ